MAYTQAEKLQTLMLCEIYRALGIKDSFNPDIIEEAISSGNYWAINWQYSSISDDEDTPDNVKFFLDTVDMYDILKYTYERFSDEEKGEISSSIARFNAKTTLDFPGFDGNNESEYLGIGHMFKLMGRFDSMNLTKNSHMPSVAIYRRMLDVFLPARAKDWTHDEGISKESFIATLEARTHPSHR